MAAMLEIECVRKSFAAQEVLKDISFTLDKGDVLSIIGRSGSGKSTLLRCINQLETVDGGTICVCGDKLVSDGRYCDAPTRARVRSHLGMVFQGFNLFPHYSVLRNITEPQVRVAKRGKADARRKLYLALKKHGALVDFSPMPDADAAAWAVRSLRALGKRMEPATAQKLVFTVGNDAALLRQEMDKLAAYTGERDAIEDADIDAVCVKTLECSVFELVDAQVAGRYAQAFTLLQNLLLGGEDRFMVLSMLLRQYRFLYHMRCLIEEGAPQAQQAGLLGIPPFAVGRTQAQARRYPKANLKAAYDYLFELEYRLKSGQAPQEGSAETALFMLDGILAGRSA